MNFIKNYFPIKKNKKGRYCCDFFKRDCSVHHKAQPNIRIIKIDKKQIPQIDDNYPYRFYLTVGYEKGEKNVPLRSFKYCPYCGTNLYNFYKSDDYINEQNHSFSEFD